MFIVSILLCLVPLVLAAKDHRKVELSWTASRDAVGYNVYRRDTPTSSRIKLNKKPIKGTTFTDKKVVEGKTYYYTTTSVTNNAESAETGQIKTEVVVKK